LSTDLVSSERALEARKKVIIMERSWISVRVCQQLGIINTKALRCKKMVEGRAGSA